MLQREPQLYRVCVLPGKRIDGGTNTYKHSQNTPSILLPVSTTWNNERGCMRYGESPEAKGGRSRGRDDEKTRE